MTTLDWDDFERWAAEQNPDDEINYLSTKSCAIARWLRSRGVRFEAVGGWYVRFSYDVVAPADPHFGWWQDDNNFARIPDRVLELLHRGKAETMRDVQAAIAEMGAVA